MSTTNTISILIAAKDEASSVIRAASANLQEGNAKSATAMGLLQSATKGLNPTLDDLNVKLAIAKQRLLEAEASGKSSTSSLMSLQNQVRQYEVDVARASETQKTFGDRLSTVGQGMATTAKSLALAALPVAILGVASVKMAADFQASMARLVTSAGESKDNLKSVSDGVLAIARETGTTTDQLGKAMYTIESGGQHGAAGLLVLKAAAQGAKAENSDLATVADAVTSVLVDYHLKADDAATVTTKLVAATSAGKTTFQELAGAMPDILPVASNAHIALSDILGDLAAMTVHGMSAQQSAQNLANVIGSMQNPTAIQAKELALLNMTTTQLAGDLKSKGLSGTLQEISDHITNMMPPGSDKVILNLKTALNGLSPAVQNLGSKLFDGTMTQKEYVKAAAALDPISAKQAMSFDTLAGSTHRIGDQQMTGASVMQNYSQALAKATGNSTGLHVALMLTGENAANANSAIKTVNAATNEAGNNVKGWAEVQSTFNSRFSQFEEILKTAAIAAGTKLLPVLTDMLKAFDNGVTHLGNFHATLKTAKDKIEEVAERVEHYLQPKLEALWNTIKDDLGPALEHFWHNVIEPIVPVLGTTLVAAFGLVVDALNLVLKTITPVMNFISDHTGLVAGLAGAFGVLAIAMNLNAAFDAITIAFNTFKLVTIPSAIATLDTFKVAVSSPMVLGAIGIGAALIALGLVLDAAHKAHDAVEGAKQAAANLQTSQNSVKSSLEAGTISSDPGVRTRSFNAIAELKKAGNWAVGGFTGQGNPNEIAGIVHKGEYVLPQSAVDQSSGLPKAGAGHQVVNNLTGTFNFANADASNAFWDRLDKTQRLARLGMAG